MRQVRSDRPRPSARITRYLISEMIVPSLYAIAAFATVVLLTDLLGYSDMIVTRGLDAGAVARVAGFQLVTTLARTLPLAVLVGVFVGLGRLAADRELLALDAIGLSAQQLAWPCLIFLILAMFVSIGLSVIASPAAQLAARNELIEFTRERPGIALRPGITTNFGGWRMEARDVDGDGEQLGGILLYIPSFDETVFSQRGAIRNGGDGTTKRIILEDGLIVSNGSERSSLFRFERMETQIPGMQLEQGLPINQLTTLPIGELVSHVRRPRNARESKQLRVELHHRLSMGASVLPLGLLAIGIALGRRELSRSKGMVIGLGGVIAYYALVQISEGLLRGEVDLIGPIVWLPNAIIGLAAISLLLLSERSWVASDRESDPQAWWRRRTGRRGLEPRMRRWALPRYVGAQFAGTVLLCVCGLTLAYLVVDVFDNLKWFNKYGATAAEISRFYAARLPVLIARVVPMALLIAVAITVGLLGANGELLGMRTCGISVLRVLAPIWLLCGLAVPVDHLLTNEIAPRAAEQATLLKRTEIKNRSDALELTREHVWYRAGTQIHEVERLDLIAGRASAVTLYELDESGLPSRRTDADSAHHLSQGRWALENPRSVVVAPSGLIRDTAIERIVALGEEVPSEINTAHLTPTDLHAKIDELEPDEPILATYRTDLQMKIAAPLACLLLPIIVLFFAATGPPFPRPAQMLIASGTIAVTHALATGFAISLGHSGALPPWLAGWGPSMLFGAAALLLGMRLRRRLTLSS